MTGPRSGGPERLTLFERFFELLHVPFTAGCILVTIFVGGPVQLISNYADTFNLTEALRRTFAITYSGAPQQVSFEVGLIGAVLYTLLTFFILYMTRFMRMRILRAESELIPLSPSGEDTYHKIFGSISNYRPQLLLALPFTLLGLSYVYNQSAAGFGVFFLVYSVVSNILFGPIAAAFIWVYFASLWGLHRFGKEPLRLKSHYEDSMLGVRPTGSLALSLAFTYFTVVVLGTLGLIISPDPIGQAFLTAGVVAGVIMFFLPLNSIHQRMVERKQQELLSIHKGTDELVRRLNEPGHDKQEDRLGRLGDVLTLQLVKQDVTAIPTWPFDTHILGRLLAIILTIAGILLSRIIYNIIIPF